jgi:hypothetical protein
MFAAATEVEQRREYKNKLNDSGCCWLTTTRPSRRTPALTGAEFEFAEIVGGGEAPAAEAKPM